MSSTENSACASTHEEKVAQATDASISVSSTDHDPQPEWIEGVKLWSIMTGLMIACFLILLDTSIIGTATPKITAEFSSLQDVGWYGAAYQLSAGALQPLTGKMYTHFQSKWLFLVFFLVFELGSLLCATAVSSNMLIVGRAVAGMGSSGIVNGALTIVATCVPMHKRPTYTGMVIGFAQIGLVGGPLIGGAFTERITWRWCFYFNLPVGAVCAALLCIVPVPEQTQKPAFKNVIRNLHGHLDLIGFILFAPAAVMLLLALQWGGNTYKWSSPTVIGLFVGGGVLLIIWAAWNHRQGQSAMIPLPVLFKRKVWVSCVYMGLFMSGMFVMSYYLPLYFQTIRGKSPIASGVDLLPSILTQVFGSFLSGKLISMAGYYLPFGIASSVLATAGYGALSSLTPSTSTGKWVGYQILVGLGRGIGMQVPMVAVQKSVLPAQIPVAMGLLVFSQTIGGAIFLSAAGTILTNSLASELKVHAPDVNATAVIDAGAYDLPSIVSSSALPGVVQAYCSSIDRIFYMVTALSATTLCLSWAMGWVDVRQPKEKKTESA